MEKWRHFGPSSLYNCLSSLPVTVGTSQITDQSFKYFLPYYSFQSALPWYHFLITVSKKPVHIIVIKKKAHLYCFQRTFYANVKLCRKLPCSLKGMMIWLEICCKVFSPKTPIVDLDGLVFFLANLKGRPRHFIRVPFDSNFSTSRDANSAAVTPNPIAHLIKTQ